MRIACAPMAIPGRLGSSRAGGDGVEPAPSPPADWPKQATDQIVKVVDQVRDKTTGPALSAAQWVIYGTVLLILGIPLLILLLLFVMRVQESLLLVIGDTFDIAWLHDPICFVYLFDGAIFFGLGLLLWRKSKAPAA